MKINPLLVIVWAIGLFATLSIGRVAFADLKSAESAYARHDYGAAFKEFQTLAHQGNAEALYQVGVIYLYGQGTARNYSGAMYCLRQAAKKGWPAANTEIGSIYMNGYGVPQDYMQALHWFQIAASSGDAEGMYMLGTLYKIGRGGIPINPDQADYWRQQAALKGYPDQAKIQQAIEDSGRVRTAILQQISTPHQTPISKILVIVIFLGLGVVGVAVLIIYSFKSESGQTPPTETFVGSPKSSSQASPLVIEEFNRRKSLRLKLFGLSFLGFFVIIAGIVMCVSNFHQHIDPFWGYFIVPFLVLCLCGAVLMINQTVWRCPKCESALPANVPSACSTCGAEFASATVQPKPLQSVIGIIMLIAIAGAFIFSGTRTLSTGQCSTTVTGSNRRTEHVLLTGTLARVYGVVSCVVGGVMLLIPLAAFLNRGKDSEGSEISPRVQKIIPIDRSADITAINRGAYKLMGRAAHMAVFFLIPVTIMIGAKAKFDIDQSKNYGSAMRANDPLDDHRSLIVKLAVSIILLSIISGWLDRKIYQCPFCRKRLPMHSYHFSGLGFSSTLTNSRCPSCNSDVSFIQRQLADVQTSLGLVTLLTILGGIMMSWLLLAGAFNFNL